MSKDSWKNTFDDIEDRFWQKVYKTSEGCWIWVAGKNRSGYGRFFEKHKGRRKNWLAHRWLYQRINGRIPKWLELDHLCRNPACVNPDHLEVVSRRINLLRGIGLTARKHAQTHCIHGHEFTPENTHWFGKNKSQRMCKRCAADRMRRRRVPTGPRQYVLATHCRRGHEFTPENIYWYGPDKKYRQCIACKQSRQKDWFASHPHYLRDRRRKQHAGR